MSSNKKPIIELIFKKPIGVRSFGDFKVEKKYNVPNSRGGKIVQIIRRNTELSDVNGIKYSTSESITEYTSGNVKFSNDDYVEVFQMIMGKSGGDMIQNGALTRYDNRKLPIIYNSIHDEDRFPYLTVGKIDVIGINFYLLTDKYKEFSKKYNPVIDHYGPANGLLAFPLTNEYEFKNVFNWLEKNSEYGPHYHHIDVKWNNDRTILSNFVNKELDEEIIHNHYIDLVENKKSKSSQDKSKSSQDKSKSSQDKSKSSQYKSKSQSSKKS